MSLFSPSDFARVIFFLFIPSQKHLGKIKLPSGLQMWKASFPSWKEQGNINISIPSLSLLVSNLVIESDIDAHLQSPH